MEAAKGGRAGKVSECHSDDCETLSRDGSHVIFVFPTLLWSLLHLRVGQTSRAGRSRHFEQYTDIRIKKAKAERRGLVYEPGAESPELAATTVEGDINEEVNEDLSGAVYGTNGVCEMKAQEETLVNGEMVEMERGEKGEIILGPEISKRFGEVVNLNGADSDLEKSAFSGRGLGMTVDGDKER